MNKTIYFSKRRKTKADGCSCSPEKLRADPVPISDPVPIDPVLKPVEDELDRNSRRIKIYAVKHQQHQLYQTLADHVDFSSFSRSGRQIESGLLTSTFNPANHGRRRKMRQIKYNSTPLTQR